MAKKKQAKKKANKYAKKQTRKSAKLTRKRAATKNAPNSLVTGFLRDFYLFLTKNPEKGRRTRPWVWPPADELLPTSLGSIADVTGLLSTAFVSSKPPPPDSSSTFLGQVAARVAAYPWPTSPDYQGEKPFGFPASTVNLYEIGQVADLMLQAVNAGGAGGDGGGGSRWPPAK